ncbi:pentapeptide repeat-containing protein [Aliikangiella sp. G2MR2-5]|uniref:pentapeptide repeat-containing protein n=1 Tax=Aliikangiella sp. G2MR2-5 TaxID=2788943 RepID=UPI0018AC3A4F|nr:pentapeptide repeat-containing protein [Aliikangiella sp. G2MR2-5]
MNQALRDPVFFTKPDNWSRWKASHGNQPIVIKDLSFKSFDFDELDFSGVSFVNCKFSDCKFRRTNLISSNLSYSHFSCCDFDSAKLIAANLKSSEFIRCNFAGSNLLTAITENTAIIESDLSGLDLQSFNLIGIRLESCDLRNQNLSNKNLSRSCLKNSDLRGANLERTQLNEANLEGVLLAGCKISHTSFKSANLKRVSLASANLSKVNFDNADLQGCDLRGADLCGACLNGAKLTGAKLFNIETIGWEIRKVECKFAYWDQDTSLKTDYKRGEFERIYADSLIIDLKYDFRLTANEIATLPIMIEHLQACHWGTSLRLKSVKDVAGGALVQLVVEEAGNYSLDELEDSLKEEASRLQYAQLTLRADRKMQKRLKEAVAGIKEQFWPRLLELAAEHEIDQIRNFCVLFIDLKGFTQWNERVISEKLSLFRGLLKPVLERWNASYPNMEGDSLRATFRSAKNAVECACMIRDVLMAAGFELRIGIDLGQVNIVHNEVTNQSDLEGSAVSMAARLEAMADTGDIVVSEKVKHYAEQESDAFAFYPQKGQLTKAIGDKKAGDWIHVYHVYRDLTD